MLALLIVYSFHKLKKHLLAFQDNLSSESEIQINTFRFSMIKTAYVSRFIVLSLTSIADIFMIK